MGGHAGDDRSSTGGGKVAATCMKTKFFIRGHRGVCMLVLSMVVTHFFVLASMRSVSVGPCRAILFPSREVAVCAGGGQLVEAASYSTDRFYSCKRPNQAATETKHQSFRFQLFLRLMFDV